MNTIDLFPSRKINRRDFLKFSSISTAALAIFPNLINHKLFSIQNATDESVPTLGRINSNTAALYDAPSFSANKLKMYWKDLVFPITSITVGDEPDYNRIWYGLNNEGFIHSGFVQPVEINLNDVNTDIPTDGRLAEVTVPFTDAVMDPRIPFAVAYRLYYGTTYWVISVARIAGKDWYLIKDDYYKMQYYAHTEHLCMITRDEVSPLSPDISPDQKRIEVILPQQVVIAYENEQPVFMSKAATGASWQSGTFETPLGRHYIDHKRPSRHMANGNLASPIGYDLPGVPWVSYITRNGISFHGTYWHNDFGKPRSHGCINLPTQSAKWIYRWTLPSVQFEENVEWQITGTQVDVIP
jgi:hypothetical protein